MKRFQRELLTTVQPAKVKMAGVMALCAPVLLMQRSAAAASGVAGEMIAEPDSTLFLMSVSVILLLILAGWAVRSTILNRHLNQFLERLPEALFVLDTTGRVERFNARCRPFLASDKGCIGHPVTDALSVSDRDAVHQAVQRVSSGDGAVESASEAPFSSSDSDRQESISTWMRRSSGQMFPVEISLSRVAVAGTVRILMTVRDVGGYNDRVEEIKRRYESLALVQSIAHLGTWDWNIVNNVVEWSDGFYTLYGLDSETFEPSYDAFLEAVHPEDRAQVTGEVAKVLENPDHHYLLEHRIIRPDGEIRHVLEHGEVHWNDAGEPVRMIGIVHDITERKEIDLIAQAQHELLRSAQRIAGLGSWRWYPARQEMEWSEELFTLFGRDAERESPGYDRFMEVMHPLDRARVEREMRAALSDPEVGYDLEHRLLREDGTERIVHAQGTVTCDTGGQAVVMTGVMLDVTERKETQADLQLARHIIDNTHDAVIITDLDGSILDVNHAYATITGYTCEEVLGRNPRLGKSGKHDQEFYDAMWREILTEGQWSGEIWDRRKSGEIYPKQLSVFTLLGEQGQPDRYVGIFNDISYRKSRELELQRLTHFDSLTGLPNRTLFKDRLDQAIVTARRRKERVALLFVDLDRFKYVNDTLGHEAGDELLKRVSERIKKHLREADTVARLGGDEFAVALSGVANDQGVALVAGNILNALKEPMTIQDHPLFIGASIGISLFPGDGETFDQLSKNAEAAMYRAKEKGRDTFVCFSPEMHEASTEHLAMEHALRVAIEENQLEVHFQPKLDLDSESIVGMEALVRWQHPEEGMISPGRFIPLAEETGLIAPIGRWVLEASCRQTKQWMDAGLGRLRVAVNLSARQFQGKSLVQEIAGVLERTALPAELLELEITESMVMDDVDEAIATLEQLKQLGVHLAIDDFGTGYSSLSYLKRFPIDTLKIDQSFVRELEPGSDEAAIVSAVLSLARDLKLGVVAEGVETREQVDYLRQKMCGQAQGFLFSKPLPAEAFATYARGVLEGSTARAAAS
ncbi:MAG: EAL domain-containing protein [Magnetococcales bacterium]|nr:EAL domain-containing protein [Magnetococcales bacterium]